MDAARCRRWSLGCLLLLLGIGSLASADEAIPLAVSDDVCQWVRPAGSPPGFLVVGSLGSPRQTFRVTIRAEATNAEPQLSRESVQPVDRKLFDDMARVTARCRRLRYACEPLPPREDVPRQRTFHIFTGERDLRDADNYARLTAELGGVGKFVQVYVDGQDVLTAQLKQAVADVIRTFDREVYPWSLRKLGQAVDFDRDGRFTVLFSSWLSKLPGGKMTTAGLDGFVRGSDFLADDAPFSNRCDMLYLNSRLRAGPHLRTVLAHEFTHAVAFSEHMVHNPPDCRFEEETWLNEGLSHLVEDLHQHGWSNMDYRVRAYLAQPHRHPLVAPDYFGTDMWRNPGNRGSAFLFLRWCQMRCGGDLPKRLAQSPFAGVRNVENAMRQPFVRLFRDWTVSLIQDGSWRPDLALPDRLMHEEAERKKDREKPRLYGASFQTLVDGVQEFTMAGTAAKFLLVPPGDGASNRRFQIQAEKGSNLQVTLIEVDRRRGLLDLHCQADGDGVRITARAHGSPIRLERICWETLPPPGTEREKLGEQNLTDGPLIAVGKTWTGKLTELPPRGRNVDLLVRVVGKDAERRVVVGCDLLKGSR